MWLQVTIQEAAFDLGAEEIALRDHAGDAGALVAFQGMVRARDHEQPLVAMHLEHYPELTEAEITRIVQQAQQQWPISACRVIHRVGRLLPNEVIVLVIVASAHRKAAFDAASYIMDYLKTEAPFWKKEEFANGQYEWVKAKASDTQAKEYSS